MYKKTLRNPNVLKKNEVKRGIGVAKITIKIILSGVSAENVCRKQDE